MAGEQGGAARPPARILRCSNPVLPDGEGALWPAASAHDRHGGQHPGDGRARLAGSGLFHASSRRQKTLAVQISSRRAPGPLNLLVDSTGIKFQGDGEWLARKHGTHRRRQYRKVHLAMDTATGDIRAVEFTSSREGDSPVLPGLLDQIPPDEQIGTVTGDGAFDTRRCHTAILDRGGTAVIPIRKNGRLWKEDCPAARVRNDILRASRRFGRATWKHWSGYHARSRIEARMPSQVRSNLWR